MVICKYFLQGCCRFGQNCRYEHEYSSKYSYQANTTTTNTNVTDDQLVSQVQSDIQAALNGGQWILSCYAPYKEKACFPGLNELSQEEARLIIYEAKANQTLEQAVTYMNNLFKETRQKYQQLLQPSAVIIKVLQSIYRGEPVSSPFELENQAFGSKATSLFRNAIQNDAFQNNTQTNSVFSRLGTQTTNTFNSAPKSIFAQAAQNTFGHSQPSNIFPTQPQDNTAAKSLFAQASQSVFGQQKQNVNVFATNQPQNVFAANHQDQSVFSVSSPQQNPANPFGIPQQNQCGNVFQQNAQSRMRSDIFASTRNVFEKAPTDDENVYSKIEDLSELDLEAYNNSEFKLGLIPELPPPHMLCV
ncbi:nucleoporin NUP42-like isoform X2 [Pieris brassicae]|uniref:nucleoporin NUP42-like isoform X2 n=1 Tax=Pieris brassicae TaxID=7116 RepID=UPI001E65F725|nr:nucleoporin NUP42-like isoform X2 [Pieris brassicae]